MLCLASREISRPPSFCMQLREQDGALCAKVASILSWNDMESRSPFLAIGC